MRSIVRWLAVAAGLAAWIAVRGAAAQDDTSSALLHVGRMQDRQRESRQVEEETLASEIDGAVARYLKAKKEIRRDTGLWYSMKVSATTQWGTPADGQTAVQGLFTPDVEWHAFKDERWGSGSFQFSYLNAQYWSRQSAASLQGTLGLNSPLNDYTVNTQFFQQVSYTHHVSGPGLGVALTVGQYSFQNFDGNAYANDQQTSFVSNSLSQNGSQAYSQGGLGAYVHLYPTSEFVLAAGFQDGNNPSGSYIQFNTFGQGQYAWFLYGGWRPTIPGLGKGHYSLLYYNLPAVWAQPLPSEGWSFNASQSVTPQLGLFVRANTAHNSPFQVQSSVGAGAVYRNPLGRDTLDRIGVAVAWNQTNQATYATSYARPSETYAEIYWSWAVYRRLILTPDLQFYLQPALAPSQQAAAVFTLRLTRLF